VAAGAELFSQNDVRDSFDAAASQHKSALLDDFSQAGDDFSAAGHDVVGQSATMPHVQQDVQYEQGMDYQEDPYNGAID